MNSPESQVSPLVKEYNDAKRAIPRFRKVLLFNFPIFILTSCLYATFAGYVTQSYSHEYTEKALAMRYGTVLLTTLLSLVSHTIGLFGTCQGCPAILRLYWHTSLLMATLHTILTFTFTWTYHLALLLSLYGAFFAYYLRKALLIVERHRENGRQLPAAFTVVQIDSITEKPALSQY